MPEAIAISASSRASVQMAADVLRPVYDRLEGRDGFVSLEVSPHLARDTRSTIEEARRLWRSVDRQNVFIKVPGTQEGIDAITELTTEGININVTLLFGLSRYKEIADAYIRGLEARVQDRRSLDVYSVASFFLSRIDVMVDPMLEEFTQYDNRNSKIAGELMGRDGDCVRKGCVPDIQAGFLFAEVQGPGEAWGNPAESAVGEHGHKEPEIQRYKIR
jgi:transaldolase